MLNISQINQVDKNQMYKIYDKWPEIAEESFNKKYEQIKKEKIEHIIFSGMGGSGTIGDIFKAILSETNIHVSVVKGYILPKTVNDKTLVICTSVSGNTIETLNVLKDAFEKKVKIIAFSSGGKIEEYCKLNRINFRKIEEYHSPRCSLTSYIYSILNILNPIIPISVEIINQSIDNLKKIKNEISSDNINNNNISLKLAKWIKEIPIIYYPNGLEAAACRFKNSLQENAKNHVIVEDIVEACHNGIVAWEKKSSVQPILLKGKNDYKKTKELWDIIEEYFKMKKIDYIVINSIEGNILAKLMSLIYILDYASIYKSILLGIDPTPVLSIEHIKSKL